METAADQSRRCPECGARLGVTCLDWQAGGHGDHTWGGKSRIWVDKEDFSGALNSVKVYAVQLHCDSCGYASQPRRMTEVEAERLQGFPDGWTEPAGTMTGRHRALGNAVAVPMSSWVARRIQEYEGSR